MRRHGMFDASGCADHSAWAVPGDAAPSRAPRPTTSAKPQAANVPSIPNSDVVTAAAETNRA